MGAPGHPAGLAQLDGEPLGTDPRGRRLGHVEPDGAVGHDHPARAQRGPGRLLAGGGDDVVGQEPDAHGPRRGHGHEPRAAPGVAGGLRDDRVRRDRQEHLRLLDPLAAAQTTDLPGEARRRQGPLAEVGRDENRAAIGIAPRQGAVRRRPAEAPVRLGHEATGVQVELLGRGGVGALLGQGDEGTTPGERPLGEHLRPAPGQVPVARVGELVDVEERLPAGGGPVPVSAPGGGATPGGGGAGGVGLPRRASPQAPGMGRADPDVVEHSGGLAHGRDAVGRVEDPLHVVDEPEECGVVAEGALGGLVALRHPGAGRLAVDLVEPGGSRRRRGGAAAVRGVWRMIFDWCMVFHTSIRAHRGGAGRVRCRGRRRPGRGASRAQHRAVVPLRTRAISQRLSSRRNHDRRPLRTREISAPRVSSCTLLAPGDRQRRARVRCPGRSVHQCQER